MCTVLDKVNKNTSTTSNKWTCLMEDVHIGAWSRKTHGRQPELPALTKIVAERLLEGGGCGVGNAQAKDRQAHNAQLADSSCSRVAVTCCAREAG